MLVFTWKFSVLCQICWA